MKIIKYDFIFGGMRKKFTKLIDNNIKDHASHTQT